MMKSRKILLTPVIVIIAFATIYAYAKEDSVFYRFGELTKDQIEISNMQDLEINGITADDNIVVKANDFVIGAKYLENLTDQNRLTGKNTKEAKNMALNQLIVKYSLYYYAINKGFLIDDETIKKSIEENREMIKTADNYSDFTTFLEGLGMSEDEYWDSQFDLYKLNHVVDEFKIAKKEEFAQENASKSDEQTAENFSDYFMDIAEEAVTKQNIKLDEKTGPSLVRMII